MRYDGRNHGQANRRAGRVVYCVCCLTASALQPCEKTFTSTLPRLSDIVRGAAYDGLLRGVRFPPHHPATLDEILPRGNNQMTWIYRKNCPTKMYPNYSRRRKTSSLTVFLGLGMLLIPAFPANAQASLARISVDTFTNSDSTHKTEVEPDTFAWGNTIVSAFHVGRRPGTIGWGGADGGFSTSTDGGKTWRYGNLPGLTVN